MSVGSVTIKDLLDQHVSLTVDCVDRLYINGYCPTLQTEGGMAEFFRERRGMKILSPVLMQRMTKEFVEAVERCCRDEGILMVNFERDQRKDDVAARIRAKDRARGIVNFVGVAQEKQTAFKASKRTEGAYVDFSYSRQSAYVKQFYFYFDDEEFGPGFIKIGTYFPFPVRLCLNGHEWAKRQLEKEGIGFESLDNGFYRCHDPKRLQEICASFGPREVQACFDRWVQRLPWPLSAEDRAAGYHHALSIWQLECSRTDVFEKPVRGREFFEAVIKENLDLGRPERVSLLFERRIQSNTPGQFRTRIITHGVAPSLHVEYKRTGIKQYFKENRALRTETTINDAGDFGIGKSLHHLKALMSIGHNVNRRILEVERVSQDCVLSEASVQRLTQPSLSKEGKKAPGMRLGDPRVMALLAALCLFLHLPQGFRNKDLRSHVEALMGKEPGSYTSSQMSYDLRRLRLKGIICRVPKTQRCELTPYGLRVSLFVTRLHARLLCPSFAAAIDPDLNAVPHPLRRAFEQVHRQIDQLVTQAHLEPVALRA